jgi:hypothetical protein
MPPRRTYLEKSGCSQWKESAAVISGAAPPKRGGFSAESFVEM